MIPVPGFKVQADGSSAFCPQCALIWAVLIGAGVFVALRLKGGSLW